MENSEILRKEFIEKKEKFNKVDKIAWNNNQREFSDILNQKMKDILSLKNNLNISSRNDNGISLIDFNEDSSKEDNIKANELKLEIDKLKYIYDSKLQQIKKLRNNLLKEKLIFEKKLNDIRSKIKKERNEINNIRKVIDKIDNETNNKKLDLDKKENLLNEEIEKCKNIQNIINEKHNKNLKDEKDLEIAEYKKNIALNELVDKNMELDDIKYKLNQEIKYLEQDKMEIFNNKNDINQLIGEISFKMNSMDNLCSNNIINQFNNLKNEIYLKEQNGGINFNNSKININLKKINNEKNKLDKFKTNSFNSELHLLKLKNRIDANRIKINTNFNNTNKKFDHAKEQEYLMKSYENFNKIKK